MIQKDGEKKSGKSVESDWFDYVAATGDDNFYYEFETIECLPKAKCVIVYPR